MPKRYIHPDQLKEPPVPEIKVQEVPITDLSIDDLLNRGIQDIYGIMRAIRVDIGTGMPSRNTVMNLKDCLTMLAELKSKEQDLLDNMTDDELAEYLQRRK